jgi:hypothetical protein
MAIPVVMVPLCLFNDNTNSSATFIDVKISYYVHSFHKSTKTFREIALLHIVSPLDIKNFHISIFNTFDCSIYTE